MADLRKISITLNVEVSDKDMNEFMDSVFQSINPLVQGLKKVKVTALIVNDEEFGNLRTWNF